MTKVAVVEAKPSRNNYVDLFDGAFSFDRFSLTSDPTLKKVLKRDVDIEIDPEVYDWIILVGSEPLKYFTKLNSVMEYSGKVVEDKFIPTINPAMIGFKPEVKPLWEESKKSIVAYVSGTKEVTKIDDSVAIPITQSEQAAEFLRNALNYDHPYVALDCETSALYPRNGSVLGISMCYDGEKAAYIDSDCIDEECEILLNQIVDKKKVIFHNSKFDIQFLQFHFLLNFKEIEDTMLMHYLIDETPNTHGLKALALKYTEFGDYEKDLYDWMDEYRKTTGIKKDDFTWDLIPFEVMYPYAAIDSLVTFKLFHMFKQVFDKNEKLNKVYREIMIPATRLIVDMEGRGVPFDRDRLKKAQEVLNEDIRKANEALSEVPEIAAFEKAQEKPFNPNSVVQLRSLLFDFIGLKPTGKRTATGALSTDAEVLETLSKVHPVPAHILSVRKQGKIKNTYVDKILLNLDSDDHLRTGFHIHTTTSGRLSSSGRFNMQQLPRDNPIVKGCIKARPGYKIVSMDLQTAEMYVAAILSGDTNLQNIFKSGGDFHSTTAKQVYKLPCSVEEVKELYPSERQATKAINFGILYGASANKISQQVTADSGKYFPLEEAEDVIRQYFKSFPKLKKWIDNCKKEISTKGFIYSAFGRKRRLPNVFSSDGAVASHEIRSGLNFLVQSVASDVNLLGAIDANDEVKSKGLDISIFALVHDSIVAEVREDLVEEYKEILARNVQRDRGFSILGSPIGIDIEVGDDYSMGKFEKMYPELV